MQDARKQRAEEDAVATEDRLSVVLPPVPDWARRVRVLLAAGVLVLSAGATGTSVASEPDDQHEGVVVPEHPSSPEGVGQGSDVETTLPDEVDPVLTAPPEDPSPGEAGPESEESEPVEVVPTDDPDAPVPLPAPPTGDPPTPPSVPVPAPAPPAPSPDAPVSPHPYPHPDGSDDGSRERERAGRLRVTTREKRRTRRRHEQAPASPAPAPQPAPAPVAPAVPETAPAVIIGHGARVHVVRRGESLWAIAQALLEPGASASRVVLEVRRLWRLNAKRIGTGDPSILPVGVRLHLR
jgi:hypothetical protein